MIVLAASVAPILEASFKDAPLEAETQLNGWRLGAGAFNSDHIQGFSQNSTYVSPWGLKGVRRLT